MDQQTIACLGLNLAGVPLKLNYNLINEMDFYKEGISRLGNSFFDYFQKGREIFENPGRIHPESGFVTILDFDYPKNLKKIPNPPLVLFYKGNKNLLQSNMISIVGTRKPSMITGIWIKYLCNLLSKNNMVTVSGLASGIDNIVHYSSREAGTIAVLPHAIDFIRSNFYLNFMRSGFNASKDLLLSEYWHTKSIQKYFYVHRNRIIAGLSVNLIVAEAGEKSGALITADYARKFNRRIFGLNHTFQINNLGVKKLIEKRIAQNLSSFLPVKIHQIDSADNPGFLPEHCYYIGNGILLEFIPQSFSLEFLLPDLPDLDFGQ